MIAHKFSSVAAAATSFLFVLAVSAMLPVSGQRAGAEQPGDAKTERAKEKALLEELQATVRDLAKLSTRSFETGTGSIDDVREATRLLLQAQLQQSDSTKDRIAVLEKFVAEAKKLEEQAEKLFKAGVASSRAALKARADRLQAELDLQREKAKGTRTTSAELPDKVALAEKEVAIKQAGLKVAEAQKKIALARLASVKAQLAESLAAESLAEKQIKRFEDLAKQQAIGAELVDERRTQWDAAKARRTAAEGKVVEFEAAVLLEQARVDLARLEAEEAELRLKQLK